MLKQAYQKPEIRDANDNIIQHGTYGKKTAFTASTNDGVLDYINNNLEWLKTQTDANTSNLGKYLPLAGGTLTGDVIIDETADRAIKGSASNVGLLYNSAAWALRDFGNGTSPIYYNKSSKQLMFPTGYRVGGTVTDSTGAVSNGNTTVGVNATDMTVKNSASNPTIVLSTGGASQSIASDGSVIRTGALEADSYSNVKTIQRGTAYSVGDIALSRKIASYMYAECTKSGVTAASTGPKFTRASVAYDDKGNQVAVNQPRFTEDGLMVEKGTTNFIPSDFTKWFYDSPTTLSDQITSPLGDASAYSLTITNRNNVCRISVACTPNTTYTFSWYAKNDGKTIAKYSVYDNTHGQDIVPSTAYPITDSWVRYSVSFTTPDGCTNMAVYPDRDNDMTGTIYLWRPQLETGFYATSYTEYGTTRNIENLSIPSSVFPTAEGTLEFTVNPAVIANYNNYFLFSSNDVWGRFLIFFDSNNILYWNYGRVTNGGDNMIIGSGLPAGMDIQISLSWSATSGQRISVVNGKSNSKTGWSVPDGLTLPAFIDVVNNYNAVIKNLRFSNTAHTADKLASDAQLSTLPLEADTTLLMPLNGNLNYLPAPDTSQIEPTFPTTANSKVTDGTVEWTLRDRRTPPNAVTNISYAGGVLTLTMGDGSTKTVSLS
jgi:hypothetical protein